MSWRAYPSTDCSGATPSAYACSAARTHSTGSSSPRFIGADSRLCAIADDPAMAHSRLSAPMNLGLLDPVECVRAAEQAYADGVAPLQSVEGYARQLIGWRDY